MKQWYREEEETVRPVGATPAPKERRYDPQTMQRAIELAAQMQADHQQTLSAAEIEAIASEAGIDPRFVRRALTLAESDSTTQRVVSRRTTRPSRRQMSRRVTGLIFGVPALYSAFLFLIICLLSRNGGANNFWPVLFCFVLPTFLLLFSALQLRRTRQGALTGLLMGLGVFFAILLATTAMSSGGSGDLMPWLVSLATAGTLLGAVATWLKRHLPVWLGLYSLTPESD